MRVYQREELKGISALMSMYVSYELGTVSEKQVAQLDELYTDWINEAQATIAKSFIASLTYKIVTDNPDIEIYEVAETISREINKNFNISNKMAIDLEDDDIQE